MNDCQYKGSKVAHNSSPTYGITPLKSIVITVVVGGVDDD